MVPWLVFSFKRNRAQFGSFLGEGGCVKSALHLNILGPQIQDSDKLVFFDLGAGGVEGKEEEEKRKCPCDRTGV